jgi:hypothetical protein
MLLDVAEEPVAEENISMSPAAQYGLGEMFFSPRPLLQCPRHGMHVLLRFSHQPARTSVAPRASLITVRCTFVPVARASMSSFNFAGDAAPATSFKKESRNRGRREGLHQLLHALVEGVARDRPLFAELFEGSHAGGELRARGGGGGIRRVKAPSRRGQQ